MEKIKIEFFHDVICSFCFPMSFNMRKLNKKVNDIEIIHRSFALMPDDESFNIGFGTRENAKKEILTHWDHANQIDELCRFNIEGMEGEDFPFPSSMIPLKASKASYFIGGESLYWDVFDSLQEGLFIYNEDINNMEVIEKRIKDLGIDLELWRKYFASEEVKNAVGEDLTLVNAYGINSAPTLIINEKYKVSGVQPLENLVKILEKIREKEIEIS